MSSMTSEPSATEELRTLGALLRAPFEALLDHVFDRLGKAGFDDVRPAHGAVLRNIAREGTRITELAERARMTKQSMAELVEHLRERGYLELAPDPSDGRAKLARLTGRGWKVHGALVRSSREFEKDCARSMGKNKWRELRALLEEFAAWSRSYTRARPGAAPGNGKKKPAPGSG
jgi:DNA-binding MarR family transcriptional regulator